MGRGVTAHILNLIVGDGMREIDASIAKVREAMRYVKSSPNRNQTFMGFMERLGIESKSLLCLDVPTRWNSTYLMLESAKNLRKFSYKWTLRMIVILHTLRTKRIVVVWDLLVVLIFKIEGHLWVF